MVKSTKRALYRALDTEKAGLRYPTDEMLRTLLKEVAGMLNGRPLTLASNDPEDFRPITPKDFLNLPPTSDLPAGDIRRALHRDHIRYVKKMANLFWDLWTKICSSPRWFQEGSGSRKKEILKLEIRSCYRTTICCQISGRRAESSRFIPVPTALFES
jgi:hypothetical protein